MAHIGPGGSGVAGGHGDDLLLFAPLAEGGATLSLGPADVPAATGQPGYIAGEILVTLAPGAGDGLAISTGASVAMDAEHLGIQLWRIPHGLSVDVAARILETIPGIERAEPNWVITATVTPNDQYFPNTWGMSNTGQVYGYTSGGTVPLSGTPDADIDAPQGWDIRTTSPIVVAVIDTGIEYTHPDLDANIWTNDDEVPGNGIDDDANGFVDDVRGWDFVNGDADPMDDNGHGTHVAGTIGAEGNNGIGVAGVAWSVELMALKFLNASGSGSTSGAIAALNYAVANGAQISNNSWGGGGYSQTLLDAISAAGAAGHLFVAAAGNNGSNNDASTHYPSSYAPANVFAVASTDDDDNLSSFSNYGATTVDIAAPGTSIVSTYKGGYAFLSGTSMATPHVAGAAALVWAENPSLTAVEVKELLMETADPLASLAGKVVSGARLNLAAALEAAGSDAPPPDVPVASIAAAHGALTEGNAGNKAFTFDVTLDAPSAGTQTVAWSVAGSGGSPANGADFGGTLPTGSVTFTNGATSRTITVQVSGDTTVESNEAFTVTLANPSSGLAIGTAASSNTILNDDTAPTGQTIIGGNGGQTLNGGSGDDTIYGLNGSDRLNGLAGNDWLDGGQGTDTMTGGQGNDVYIRDANNDVVTEAANEGADTVVSSVAYTLPSNVEALVLSGTSGINGTGNGLANWIVGNAGANKIDGAAGADTMEGAGGNDTYVADNAGDVVVEANGGGTDVVQSSVTYTIGDFVEELALTGSSGIGGTGNAQANLITGNTGANALAGAGGNDTLVGGNGADSLTGGDGSDSLYGGNARDVLVGGTGVDYFGFGATGESARGSNRDAISDFAAEDFINLSAIDASSRSGGNQAFTFIGTSAFSGTAGQLRLDATLVSGAVVVQGDTNGDRTADIEIEVRGFTALTAQDFLL